MSKRAYDNDERAESPEAKRRKTADDCSICLHTLAKGNIFTTTCNHSFHYGCILQLFENITATCPLCRSEISLASEDDEQVISTINHKLHYPEEPFPPLAIIALLSTYQYIKGEFTLGAFKSHMQIANILDFENLASLLIHNPCKTWTNMAWITLYTLVFLETVAVSVSSRHENNTLLANVKCKAKNWLQRYMIDFESNKEVPKNIIRYKHGEIIDEELHVRIFLLFV
jgi:hypothetical protein